MRLQVNKEWRSKWFASKRDYATFLTQDLAVRRLIDQKLGSKIKVIIPEKEIISFKEALVFGFLGVLRLRGENNVLKTVTGARKNSCSAILIGA